MAYVANSPEEDEALKKAQGQAPTIAGTDLQAAPALANSSGAGPTSAAGSPTASGFTDVNAYLDANKDQSLDLANKVSQQFSKDATAAQSDIDNTANQFKGTVDQTSVNPNAGLVNSAASDPTNFVTNADNLAQFQKMRDANYQGPTSFESGNDYSRLQGEVGTALQNQGNIDSEQGRQSLLYGMGNNPTAGQVSLDQLLLGSNPNARTVLASAAKPFAGLTDYLNSAASGADQYATTAKANTAQAGQLVADKFTNPTTGVVPQFQQQLQGQAAAGQQQEGNYNNQLNDVVGRLNASQDLTPGESQNLGLQPGQVNALYGLNNISQNYNATAVNPSQYYTPGHQYNVQATASNTATPDQVAKAAALQQLMGTAPVQGFDPTQAGQFQVPQSLGTFDATGANQAGIQNLMAMDKAFLQTAPPANGTNIDQANWIAKAQAAQARLNNPALYNQDPSTYANPTAGTPGPGGLIDPVTGQPIYQQGPPGGQTSGGGRAYR